MSEINTETPGYTLAELLADVLDAYNISAQAARIADALMSAMNTPGGTLGLDDHIVDAQEMVGEDQK